MTMQKITLRIVLSIAVVILLSVSATAYSVGRQDRPATEARAAEPTPQSVDPSTPSSDPPYLTGAQSQSQPAAVSSTLSYYSISGNTVTPDAGSVPYYRQATGCVNQMPLNSGFSAPVHLPQASVVVSITLYTYDSAITTTVGTAYFRLSDGKGLDVYTLSASSQPNTVGYQQNQSAQNNPRTVDNATYSYYVQWRTTGSSPSPYLGLCGVRVAYYAPLGPATYLPSIFKDYTQ